MGNPPVSNFNRALVIAALGDSFRKLSPRLQFRNPWCSSAAC
jgi:K+-transporting ATPase ATPase B chain